MPDPIDARTHRALAGASRVRVLEFLRGRPAAVTATEIAEQVGLHPNTVRLHLDQLVAAGLVTRTVQRRGGRGRPRLLYADVVQPPGAEPEGESYRALAGVLAGRLEATSARPDDDAAAAGRAWGRDLAGGRATDPAGAADHLVRLMDRLGFAPTQAGPEAPIELHRCPFRQVAEEHSRVVCGVHLGLMQGVLESLGAPLQATRLEPFVTPDLCLAHLAPASAECEGADSTPVALRTPPQPTEGFPS